MQASTSRVVPSLSVSTRSSGRDSTRSDLDALADRDDAVDVLAQPGRRARAQQPLR